MGILSPCSGESNGNWDYSDPGKMAKNVLPKTRLTAADALSSGLDFCFSLLYEARVFGKSNRALLAECSRMAFK